VLKGHIVQIDRVTLNNDSQLKRKTPSEETSFLTVQQTSRHRQSSNGFIYQLGEPSGISSKPQLVCKAFPVSHPDEERKTVSQTFLQLKEAPNGGIPQDEQLRETPNGGMLQDEQLREAPNGGMLQDEQDEVVFTVDLQNVSHQEVCSEVIVSI
jgi:hypothetical protein